MPNRHQIFVCTTCHSLVNPRRELGRPILYGFLLAVTVIAAAMQGPGRESGAVNVREIFIDASIFWGVLACIGYLARIRTNCEECGSTLTVPTKTRVGQIITKKYAPSPDKEN